MENSIIRERYELSMERILKRWLPKEMLVYKEDGNGE